MKKWLKRLKKDERGLTLVELLAVVVILAIVAAIAFISIGKVIENSKQDAHVANALQIISAAKLYEAGSGDELSSVVIKDIDTVDGLIDPWTKEKYSAEKLGAGKVEKSGDVYSVTLEDDGGKCLIDEAPEEKLRKDGRKVCDTD